MILSLPIELQELILSFLTRKEYKETVPCKGLLLCRSYLSLKKFIKLNKLPKYEINLIYGNTKELPIVRLSPRELKTLFIESCGIGNVWLVDRLIVNFKVDPSVYKKYLRRGYYYVLSSDCIDHDDDTVIFTCNDGVLCGTDLYEEMLHEDSCNGYYDVSRDCIIYTDPQSIDAITLRKGYYSEYRIKRKNSSDYNHRSRTAIQYASEKGRLKVVERLLQDPRITINLSICDNYVILLALGKISFNEYNYALQMASIYGHLEIVKRLLQDPRVDPSANNNIAFNLAKETGHTKVLALLLKDPRVYSKFSWLGRWWYRSN